LRDQAIIDQQAADQARLAAQQLAAQAIIDQTAAAQAAQANVLLQNNIQQDIHQAVQLQTQPLQDQFTYAEVGEEMAMYTTKTFSSRELEDPKKHVERFKLNFLAKKLPVAAADQLQARFGYFGETLTDAASEWFDALVLANIQDMQTLYDQFQARFAFNITNQWRENQVFRQTKQKTAELSTDFIRKVEAEGVRKKSYGS